jgi:purine catabolism regulator
MLSIPLSEGMREGRMQANAVFEADEPPREQDEAYPAIGELLSLSRFAGIRLLTDVPGTLERRITGTSVQEVPLDNFVRSGELVMTTAMGLDSPGSLSEFVRRIAAAGAAGLAVAVGGHVSTIPSSAVATARQLGLPLLEFPWALRFSEVAEFVLGQIVDRQHAWLHRSQEIQDLFTRIVLRGGDLSELCRFVEKLLVRPCWVVNQWGETTTGGPGSLAESQTVDEGPPIEFPIKADHKAIGTLLIASTAAPLSQLDSQIARHATTAAALISVMEQANEDGEARRHSEFLAALLSGQAGGAGEVKRRSRALGVDPDQLFAVYHVTFRTADATTHDEVSEVGRWAVRRAAESRHVRVLQGWDGPDLTLIVPLGRRAANEAARVMFDYTTALVVRHNPAMSATAGIGRVADGIGSIPKSLREAIIANRLGALLDASASSTAYASLGAYPALYDALREEQGRAAFAELQERYIGAAVRYEAEAGLPLLATLTAYFDERGNVSATARRLGINRQSLLYRLEKIELLTGVDLSSAMDRFALELALRSREVDLDNLRSSVST